MVDSVSGKPQAPDETEERLKLVHAWRNEYSEQSKQYPVRQMGTFTTDKGGYMFRSVLAPDDALGAAVISVFPTKDYAPLIQGLINNQRAAQKAGVAVCTDGEPRIPQMYACFETLWSALVAVDWALHGYNECGRVSLISPTKNSAGEYITGPLLVVSRGDATLCTVLPLDLMQGEVIEGVWEFPEYFLPLLGFYLTQYVEHHSLGFSIGPDQDSCYVAYTGSLGIVQLQAIFPCRCYPLDSNYAMNLLDHVPDAADAIAVGMAVPELLSTWDPFVGHLDFRYQSYGLSLNAVELVHEENADEPFIVSINSPLHVRRARSVVEKLVRPEGNIGLVFPSTTKSGIERRRGVTFGAGVSLLTLWPEAQTGGAVDA